MRRMIALVAACLLLAACEARINTSSPEAYSKSMAAVTKDLSPEKKQLFTESVMAVAFDTADPASMQAFGSDAGGPLLLAAVQSKLKGKTADQVIKLGYETRIRKLNEEIAKGISQVTQAKAEREKFKAVFDGVVVSNPRFYVQRSFIDEPTIDLTITNNTKMAIRRGFFHGVLTSPGRTIPWVDDDFNYEFTGGLEPGETKRLQLAPNMFGPWGDREFNRRTDLELKVTVVNLEDAEGQALLKGDPGEAAAQERELVKLQTDKKELEQALGKL